MHGYYHTYLATHICYVLSRAQRLHNRFYSIGYYDKILYKTFYRKDTL